MTLKMLQLPNRVTVGRPYGDDHEANLVLRQVRRFSADFANGFESFLKTDAFQRGSEREKVTGSHYHSYSMPNS